MKGKKQVQTGTSGATGSDKKPLTGRQKDLRRSVMDREGLSEYSIRVRKEAVIVLEKAREQERVRIASGWKWIRCKKGWVLKGAV